MQYYILNLAFIYKSVLIYKIITLSELIHSKFKIFLNNFTHLISTF